MLKKLYLLLAVTVPAFSSGAISRQLCWEFNTRAIITLPDDPVVAIIKESATQEAYCAAMESQTERFVINHLVNSLNELRDTLYCQKNSPLPEMFKELAQKLDEHASIKQIKTDVALHDYLISAMTDYTIDTFLNMFRTMTKEQQQDIIKEFLSSLCGKFDEVSRPAGISEILDHVNFFHVNSDSEILPRHTDGGPYGVPSTHIMRRSALYDILLMRACLHENISSKLLVDVVEVHLKEHDTTIRNFVRYYLLGDGAPEFYYWPKPMASKVE
jgi:hypothetical protein